MDFFLFEGAADCPFDSIKPRAVAKEPVGLGSYIVSAQLLLPAPPKPGRGARSQPKLRRSCATGQCPLDSEDRDPSQTLAAAFGGGLRRL